MKLPGFLVFVLLALAGCVAPAPPGFTPITSDTARFDAYGYSVQTPGQGWLFAKNDYGLIFGKRVDATVSYHAGISVVRVAAITDKKAFLEFVMKKTNEGSDSFRYKIVRNDFKEEDRDGLWVVRGRLDFDDSGAVNVGSHASLATRTASLFALDPNDPERLVTLWYSWRGADFNESAFSTEASRFIGSLQGAKLRTPVDEERLRSPD